MKKGIGNAFSITFDETSDGLVFNDHVDVDQLVAEHEKHYNEVLFNPAAIGKGFNLSLYARRKWQMIKDRKTHERLFPKPFYTEETAAEK